ncbi:MAG: Sua5/YciO/YrdC/YwlC family protein, partial [Butyrivibrio sp.]|nr:Sua5/YciO/YrdC/YwlC family protein [Butyrivibrio sp.]
MRSIIRVIGAVQGVGYRPFILRKATEYGIKGYVKNLGASVEILAIGEDADVLSFVEVLKTDAPVGAIVLDVRVDEITDTSDIYPSFRENSPESEYFSIINSSEIQFNDLPIFLPDIGICDDCMSEMLDPSDRRYRYPLISCASCGPRISILNKLPYDRDTTTMDKFKMCPKCDVEYRSGRRTHAQTISCHDCGPQMILDFYSDITDHTDNESKGKAVLQHIEFDDAVITATELLRNDNVIGLKGISGYQLVSKPVGTVALKLRQLKGRENKPFAVMFSDICSIKEYCHVSEKEEELLKSSARPIVLLEKKKDFDYEVCKDSRYIGAFLPSSGIHRLLTDAVGPLIVT